MLQVRAMKENRSESIQLVSSLLEESLLTRSMRDIQLEALPRLVVRCIIHV